MKITIEIDRAQDQCLEWDTETKDTVAIIEGSYGNKKTIRVPGVPLLDAVDELARYLKYRGLS